MLFHCDVDEMPRSLIHVYISEPMVKLVLLNVISLKIAAAIHDMK